MDASSSSLERWSLALGEEALRFEREEVVAGKHEDGSSKSREAKLAVMYTTEGRDPETGAALKDRDSATFSFLIESAAAASGSTEPSDFAGRFGWEAQRRGLHDAGEIVFISDGAEWIRNTSDEIFGVGKVTFVLDM